MNCQHAYILSDLCQVETDGDDGVMMMMMMMMMKIAEGL